ncbi:MAG: hypothetical protein OER97_01355 [Gammaproteobacteria bacterium]|nr:hypothetical protein [Gammaproteobacteria bacterium]
MKENLPETTESDRWMLLRDAAVLQVKLVVDGLRDLVLVPASLIAAIVSLVTSDNGKPGPHFYRLLAVGKRSERWIDLFAAYQHSPDGIAHDEALGDASIDDIVHRMESFVVDEYKRGGVTAQAKERIDRALSALQRREKSDE